MGIGLVLVDEGCVWNWTGFWFWVLIIKGSPFGVGINTRTNCVIY